MRHATNRVKGFYAKTNKPARLNMFVGLAWLLPRLLSGTRAALCARVTAELKTAANPLPTFNKQLSAFPAHATFSYLPCPGGGMADAEDLKSSEDFSSWEFESPPGHFRLKHLRRIERLSESSNPPPNYLIFTSALRSPY